MKDKTFKILFLINSLEQGGAEEVFMRETSALTKQGYKVWLGVLREGDLDPPANVSYYNFKFNNIYSVAGYQHLYKFIRNNNITHLYATLDEASIIARILSLFLPDLSVSVRESGLPSRKPLKLKLFDILLNWNVKTIVAVSKGVARDLAKYQFFYKRKIIVVENGIVIPQQSCQGCVDKRVTRSQAPVQILAVGKLTKEKNHKMLIGAFTHTLSLNPGRSHLTIVGDGPLYYELNQMIKALKIENLVTLTGPLPFKDVQVMYQNVDMFAHSSLGEGFPNVVLEAMSYALPIVSTSVPGSVDAIENESSGLLVEIGDDQIFARQLERLIEDRLLRVRLGLAACERVRSKFSFSSHIESLIKALGIRE